MTTGEDPHPNNAPGPFYVTNGCCTACGVPESIAPELFAADDDGHCFVKRQPATSAESDSMLRVLRTQELGCIRYAGSDADVRRRLGEAGESAVCDHPLVPAVSPVARVRAVIRASADGAPVSPEAVASSLRASLLSRLGERGRATAVRAADDGCSFTLAWYGNDFHRVEVRALWSSMEGNEVLHGGPIGLSDLIDECLRAEDHQAIEWSTRTGEHRASRPW
ncbi:MAG: ferredoxin [Deltaproteobacteria bacterium]|nr:ferredoxin [Deltaproteobacteria bacterium]